MCDAVVHAELLLVGGRPFCAPVIQWNRTLQALSIKHSVLVFFVFQVLAASARDSVTYSNAIFSSPISVAWWTALYVSLRTLRFAVSLLPLGSCARVFSSDPHVSSPARCERSWVAFSAVLLLVTRWVSRDKSDCAQGEERAQSTGRPPFRIGLALVVCWSGSSCWLVKKKKKIRWFKMLYVLCCFINYCDSVSAINFEFAW